MPELAPKTELMRSLGRLIRGLSAIFWGLPITLIVCLKSGAYEWLKGIGALPPVIATFLLFYGLLQLGYFQTQERIWHSALDRAKIFALVNVGLSPFLYFWHRMPNDPFFTQAVALLIVTGLVFLFTLNQVLQRLTAMLPDETLRTETKLFTELNRYLIMTSMGLIAFYLILVQIHKLPLFLIDFAQLLVDSKHWLLLILILFPLAMTMTLIWKIKELILTSVFDSDN
jgi:hypothetical protein